MNFGPLIFLGLFFSLACSWFGLVLAPQIQLGRQGPKPDENGQIYPTPRLGLARQGAEVYRAEGCFHCHSQQVRPAILGSDLARGWGKRFSVAQDYLYDQPVMLGSVRIGPDVANIGARAPENYAAAWKFQTASNQVEELTARHLLHLYNPRLFSEHSTMPAYSYLFETRPITRQPSPEALVLTGSDAPPAGFEVVPKPEAKALVAYLTSLQAEAPLFEAPLPRPPGAPVTDTNAPAASTNVPATTPVPAP